MRIGPYGFAGLRIGAYRSVEDRLGTYREYTHLYVPICGVKIRWSVCIVLYCIVFHCSNFVSQEVGALGGWDRCAGFSANFFQLFLLNPHSLDFIGFNWILLDFIGFNWILLDFIGFNWILLD